MLDVVCAPSLVCLCVYVYAYVGSVGSCVCVWCVQVCMEAALGVVPLALSALSFIFMFFLYFILFYFGHGVFHNLGAH